MPAWVSKVTSRVGPAEMKAAKCRLPSSRNPPRELAIPASRFSQSDLPSPCSEAGRSSGVLACVWRTWNLCDRERRVPLDGFPV